MPPSLEQFGQALQLERPFASDRVSEPVFQHPDVPAVHEVAFSRLTDAAKEVYHRKIGRGMTVLGAAGVGKSHLLTRLAGWAKGSPGATFVFLHNLLVAPERLPRYMLAATIGVLGNRRFGDSGACPLLDLWIAGIRKTMNLADEADITPIRAKQGVEALLDSSEPLDRAIRQVLLRVGLHMHLFDQEKDNANRAVVQTGLDWLSGEPIEPETADLLGLPKSSPVLLGLRDDQDVECVLRVIADLSHVSGRPFIVCVDQFDNLSSEQVAATTRFLHVLLDHIPNLLCVLSGVRSNVMALVDAEVIPAANWDRVAEERVELDFVPPKLAFAIVQRRVEQFRNPFWTVPEIEARVKEDPLFPLTRAAFDVKVGSAVSIRPREIIRWARDAWWEEAKLCAAKGVAHWLEAWPGGSDPTASDEDKPQLWPQLVDETVETALAEQMKRRTDNKGSLPSDAGNIEALLMRLLECARDLPGSRLAAVGKAPSKARCEIELRAVGGRTTGVGLVIAAVPQASTFALGKLLSDAERFGRVVLVSDEERRPIKRTKRAEEYLEELEGLGDQFAHLKLTFLDHARLDALVSVIDLAKAGDLEVEWSGGTTALSPAEVVKSYERTGRLTSDPVLSVLLPPAEDSGLGGTNASASSTAAGDGAAPPAEEPAASSTGPSASRAHSADDRSADALLLALTAVRPEVSLTAATRAWCETHPEDAPESARCRLERAALRLSLAGQLGCRLAAGLLRVARAGSFLNSFA